MDILQFILKPKLVLTKINNDSSQGEEIRTSESPEKPIDDCFPAMQKLADVVVSVLELPTSYIGKAEAETLRPYGFKVSYTANGTRSMSVLYNKALRCGKIHRDATPFVQIDEPSGDESEQCALAAEEQVVCNNALAQAVLYVGGTRQQQTMDGLTIGYVDPDQEALGLED